jgi:hypothetical protein
MTESHDSLLKQVAKLRRELEQFDKAAKRCAKDAQRYEELAAEVTQVRIEVDGDDLAAVQMLTAKEAQLQILRQRVEATESVLEPLAVQVRETLAEIPDLLRAFLDPSFRSLIADISLALLPYFKDAGVRQRIAHESDAVRQFHNFLLCLWHPADAPVITAREVLNDIDAVLAGRTPWIRTQ